MQELKIYTAEAFETIVAVNDRINQGIEKALKMEQAVLHFPNYSARRLTVIIEQDFDGEIEYHCYWPKTGKEIETDKAEAVRLACSVLGVAF